MEVPSSSTSTFSLRHSGYWEYVEIDMSGDIDCGKLPEKKNISILRGIREVGLQLIKASSQDCCKMQSLLYLSLPCLDFP